MISYIRGELAETAYDSIVVDVGGIGYRIYVPSLMQQQLPPVGEEIKIHTYLQVREDAFVLFGFLEKDDLEMFRLLIAVNGVGPKAGLSILSTLPANDLRFAIYSGDTKAISKAPGIGGKTAQRIILDLRDKVDFEEALEKKSDSAAQDGAAAGDLTQIKKDAVLALVALGYSQTESLKAVTKVEASAEMEVEDVLRNALKHMTIL